MNLPKFRAWHKEKKKMFNLCGVVWIKGELRVIPENTLDVQCDLLTIHDPSVVGKNIELMQWTGLQDKNGKDIYEGDILVYHYGGGVESYIIERQSCDNQLHARYLHASGWVLDYLGDTPLESSVIVGNQFENPELLGVDDE